MTQQLFGRPEDNLPMEGQLVELRVTGNDWVQVTRDTTRAGTGLLNFAVDDIDEHRADLATRGLHAGPVATVNKGVQLSAIADPDGNRITFIGRLRLHY